MPPAQSIVGRLWERGHCGMMPWDFRSIRNGASALPIPVPGRVPGPGTRCAQPGRVVALLELRMSSRSHWITARNTVVSMRPLRDKTVRCFLLSVVFRFATDGVVNDGIAWVLVPGQAHLRIVVSSSLNGSVGFVTMRVPGRIGAPEARTTDRPTAFQFVNASPSTKDARSQNGIMEPDEGAQTDWSP